MLGDRDATEHATCERLLEGGSGGRGIFEATVEQCVGRREIEAEVSQVGGTPVRASLERGIARSAEKRAVPVPALLKVRSHQPIPGCAVRQAQPVRGGIGLAAVL